MNNIKCTELSIAEMRATYGGVDYRCWMGGFSAVAGVLSGNALWFATGVYFAYEYCPSF